MYTLAKQARNLEAFKLARHVLDRLQKWRVPERFQVSSGMVEARVVSGEGVKAESWRFEKCEVSGGGVRGEM